MKIKKRADGRYRAKRTRNGKVIYFYGKTRQELEEKLKTFESEGSYSSLVKSISFSEWASLWLEEKSLQIRQNTLISYTQIIHTHLLPAFDNSFLVDLSTPMLRKFMTDKQKSNLSPRVCQYIYTILNAILNQAVKDELIQKNPLTPIPKPQSKAHGFVSLTAKQLRQFLDSIPNPELRFIFALDAATGLRRSELLGLRWKDIDFNRKTLSVTQTVLKINNKPVITQNTKNTSSRRSISLDDKTIAGLKKQLTRSKYRRISCGSEWTDNDLVFPDTTGEPLQPDLLSKNAVRYAQKAGLPEGFTFHSLRHTHATLLLQAGVHFKIVQHRLGHASFNMTMDIYSHVTPEMDKEAAELMEKVI